MEVIGTQKIWSFVDGSAKATLTTCPAVRKATAYPVTSFVDLARKIAERQFLNRDHVLLFRGQSADYRNRYDNTSLKPTLLRALTSKKVPTSKQLQGRFEQLGKAEKLLVEHYRKGTTPGATRLRRQQILRWALLQHYEVCGTPLLDVSQSLRIAASFATSKGSSEAFVFVLGVPNVSGAITASAEAGIQVVRLASVCPPSALRPHLQEGYLLGEYPEMVGVSQKEHYAHYEMDFGRRLIAKFRFVPRPFWQAGGDFPQVGNGALYPNAEDPLFKIAESIKSMLDPVI